LNQKNLAVELLEKLIKGDIKAKCKTNVVQEKKFSDRLQAKDFTQVVNEGEDLGLSDDQFINDELEAVALRYVARASSSSL